MWSYLLRSLTSPCLVWLYPLRSCLAWLYTLLPGHPHPTWSCCIHLGQSSSPCSVWSYPSRQLTLTLLSLVTYIKVAHPHSAQCGHIHWGQSLPPCSVSSYISGSAKLTLLSPIIYIGTWSPPPYLIPSYVLTLVLLTPLEGILYLLILYLVTLSRVFCILHIYMLDGLGHVLYISYILGPSQYHPYMSGVSQAGSPYAMGKCDYIIWGLWRVLHRTSLSKMDGGLCLDLQLPPFFGNTLSSMDLLLVPFCRFAWGCIHPYGEDGQQHHQTVCELLW